MEAQRAETDASTAKIENSMHRYEENNRLLNSFYAPNPNEQERERSSKGDYSPHSDA